MALCYSDIGRDFSCQNGMMILDTSSDDINDFLFENSLTTHYFCLDSKYEALKKKKRYNGEDRTLARVLFSCSSSSLLLQAVISCLASGLTVGDENPTIFEWLG